MKLRRNISYDRLKTMKLRFLLALLVLTFLSGCATVPKKEMPPEPAKRVPGGLYHTVSRGETLWGISRTYGVTLQSLIKANPILYTNGIIENGQVLLIPRSGAVAPVTTVRAVPGELFSWPIRGQLIAPYGAVKNKVVNKGIDIKAAEGAGVRASRSGKVVYCDQFLKGFGKTVIIDHGDNYQTVYSYNSDILVNVGEQVAQNTVIAKVGRTGRATMPALHFEIRRDGEPQNPAYYLPR
ncbi:MAG: LysM peptidoglycan-binding domain-containing M23 family metallopeptidase [Candidatus Omnitrophica bacterium]|nr:LysM peptidoglycan-binding domain-containing M23 family metallopeptidase [Candidatus Omnitrophota bacterium]MDD5437003.1 LysM peptidoglycan-binding domain-containing M23 family metallopeptidase [Candidatus Omnitrophota bacterium]